MNQQDGLRFLRKDPIRGKIIDNVGDYSLKRRNHHFAVLVESIISQQLATSAAEVIFRRFRKIYPKLPTADQILSTRKSKLRAAELSGMKIDYLKDLARNIKEGRLNMKLLSKLCDEEVIDHLTQVKGIGRWTAEMFLIFSLGRPDVL